MANVRIEELAEKIDPRIRNVQKWILIGKFEWSWGFKKKLFGPDGMAR